MTRNNGDLDLIRLVADIIIFLLIAGAIVAVLIFRN